MSAIGFRTGITSQLADLLTEATHQAAIAMGITEPAALECHFAAADPLDPDDGPSLTVVVTADCRCQYSAARYLETGTIAPHAVVQCLRHRPVVVNTDDSPAVPF